MENETLGMRMRTIRKKKGLTQKQLGELCGIDEANIRKYELGKQNPKYGTIFKIADALDVHYDFLIFGDNNPYREMDLNKVIGIIDDELLEKINNTIDETYSKEIKEELRDLLYGFLELNLDGRKKLFERIDELLEMPKYTEKENK